MEKNFAGQINDEEIELSVDDLFKDPEDSQPQETETSTDTDNVDNTTESEPEVNLTENMRHRINDVRRKTETETQERIAKDLGYESYAELQRAKETTLIREHGFDEEDVEKLLNPLIESRLANDPRFKKLEAYEQREKEKYLEAQLAEINEVSNVKYDTVNDLPQETIDLWSKGVDLDKAYLATAGKDLIMKSANKAKKGSMSHLAPTTHVNDSKVRPLTDYEKDIYRSIMPDITDEELASKTTEIK